MNRRTQTDEVEMVATEFHPSGLPAKYEVVRTEQAPVIGWDDDVNHIVSPLPEARVVKAQSIVEGSWSDRARGFNLSTRNLSLVVGGMFLIAAWVLGPSLSFWALAMWYFAGFSLTWLVAYALHVLVSAEGAQFLDTVYLWKFLFREQAHRWNRYAPQRTERERLVIMLLGAGAVLCLSLFALLIIGAVAVEMMPR